MKGFVVLANLMNRADIRMIQGRSGLCLALEARQRLWIFDDRIRQKLQGHEATQVEVLGLVDDPHTATTEFLDNAVMRDGLADHRQQRILRRRGKRVNEGTSPMPSAADERAIPFSARNYWPR
jgi:hypothetical protein